MEGCWKGRSQGRVPGLHQGGMDRYEAVEPSKENGGDGEESTASASPAKREECQKSDDLVDKLSEGDHPVEVGLRPERTVKLFEGAIDRDYVHVKFLDTRGGTELGVRLDRPLCDFSKADFEAGTGSVHVEGGLTLNYVKVRCIAEIDLGTLEGKGYLVKVEAQA